MALTTLSRVRWLRHASLAEGTTLLVLVAGGLPLKYGAGYPLAVTVMGSVHGFAFLSFMLALAMMAFSTEITRREFVQLFIGACIPCGAFFNARLWRGIEARHRATSPARDHTSSTP